MNGLFDAMALGVVFSLLSGALCWLALTRFSASASDVTPWQLVRLAILIPFVAAPLIFAVPDAAIETTAFEPSYHQALPSSTLAAIESEAMPTSFTLPGYRSLLGGIYLAGLAIMIVMAATRHIRRQRLLAVCRLPRAGERGILEQAGMACTADSVPVLITSLRQSPILTGWHGVIIIPETLFSDAMALRHALRHELTHHRRGDEKDRLIGSALKIVLWFHLPLHWVESALAAARELACDNEAVQGLGSNARTEYAAALIATMRLGTPEASAFGAHDRRHRKMRIQAILNTKASGSRRLIIRTILAIGVALPLTAAQAIATDRRNAPQTAVQFQPAPEQPAPLAEPAPVIRAEPAASPAAAQPVAIRVTSPQTQPETELAFGTETAPEPVSPSDVPEISFGSPDSEAPFVVEPVLEGRISSQYGARPARPASAPVFHNGTDIAAPEGTSILAPAAGRVVHADLGFQGNEAWGNTVAIDHGDGWQSVYAHMQGYDVAVGDTVLVGQQIGRVGSTGRSTGPHLHLEVRQNGEHRDPANHVPGLR
ncbi:MAG: hypothetical protein DHS20C06_17050 [Hyphobacterium sp.]|nr:MAG: hypothetical protein DHS20C06_17050 [Hyphobacterium sp.]